MRECYDLEDPSIRGAFFERLFEEHPHASGILVTNASGHHAGKWLAERCLKEKHAVVCWDLVPSNVEALIAGEVDCILSQKPADQARYAMDRLFKAIVRNDRSGAEELVMPLEIYFRENLPAARPSDNPRSEEYDEREFA